MKILNKKGKPVFNSDINIVTDGNSLFEQAVIDTRLLSSSLLSGTGVTCSDFAISGQTFDSMLSTKTDIDNAYVVGKRNILIFWEMTNKLTYGSSVSATIDSMVAYINGLKSVHPDWEMYTLTTLPRRITENALRPVLTLNTLLDECNDLLRKNYKSYGIDGLIDIRLPDSPFSISNYNADGFAEMDAYWHANEKSTDSFSTHLNSEGYALITKFITQKLRSIG